MAKSPPDDEDRPPLGDRLSQAITDAGMSIRGYARLRAERQWGPDPTQQQVESKRRQLMKWIAGDTPTISDPVAAELASDLGKPAAYFTTPRKPRRRRGDEIAELRGQLAELRARLDGLEQLVRAEQEARRPRRAGGSSQQ